MYYRCLSHFSLQRYSGRFLLVTIMDTQQASNSLGESRGSNSSSSSPSHLFINSSSSSGPAHLAAAWFCEARERRWARRWQYCEMMSCEREAEGERERVYTSRWVGGRERGREGVKEK